MNSSNAIIPLKRLLWASCLILAVTASPALATAAQRVAALPFSIQSDINMDYVKKGISRMLYSRLTWPEKVVVVPPEQINKTLALLPTPLPESQLVNVVAKETGSDYVLSGTITRFDGAFSIDAKVFDIDNKRYMAFSQRSGDIDDLIQKVDRIAAAINHRIFKRSTVTWEEMTQEQQKDLNDLKRKNPEYLMDQYSNGQTESQKEKIGWKIWKYLF
ncbi:MAG: hypothetical protein CSA29_05775 [Desulfobacterales bacterium]|nr:MAG: hypothetical protein CSA29_05775 [Desulfobacterales bacterium]